MAKKIMSLLVVMIMMISLLCGVVFAYDYSDPIPEAEAVVPDAAVAFRNALAAGGDVNLTESVTVENAHTETDLNVVTKDANINFGDNTFTLDVSGVYANPNWKGLDIRSGNVTINANNGGIVNKNTIEEGNLKDNIYCIYVGSSSSSANVTITGGNYVAGCTAVHVKNGSVTIKGGTFEGLTKEYFDYVINCDDKSYAAGNASVSIEGGTFIEYDPSNSSSENPKASFVAPGYKTVASKDANGRNIYTVVVDEEYNFFKAIAEGGNVTLNADIELSKLIYVEKTVTINLNGHNIIRSAEGDRSAAFYVDNADVVLTIEGEGNVSSHGPAVWVEAGKAILKGGTYNSIESSTIYSGTTGYVEVMGGTYKNDAMKTDASCYVLNLRDSDRETASISVKGGTYINWDPSNNGAEGANTNFVADGYKAYANGSNYVIGCAHNSLAGYPHKEPTYVEEGCHAYYECNDCHKLFMDASATVEVTNKSDLVIPKLIEIKGTEAIVSQEAVVGAIADSQDSAIVELPVLVTDETVKEVTLPMVAVENVAILNKGLLIENSDVTVTLDAKTVATVAEEAKDATKITIEVTKEETKILNTAQKEAVKDKEVEVVISAKILADGKEISDFKGGKVTVEIPFKLAEGYVPEDYSFIYIDDDGKVTEIPSKYFDGIMVVELEHFSEYAIVKANSTSTPSGDGNTSVGTPSTSTPAPAPAPAAPVKDNTPKTGAISVIGLVSAMAVGGLVLTRKRK